ncbi:MAG: packaged DNA stabilization gp4 family protein [Desulfatitalea sp.]|nr:packaged DNA stabilization gp4 family protein [Desulfatitalea sp.]
MSSGDTKADLINGAFSKLTISGITVSPSAPDNELALSVLESMMREYKGECLGYSFEDYPDTGTKSGLDPEVWDAVKALLAVRLMPDYGKGSSAQANVILTTRAGGAESFLASKTARPRETQYPSRQPLGSGNRVGFSSLQDFYPAVETSPNDCETKTMFIGDTSTFDEDFNSYLENSEYIDTFAIDANTGLTVVSSSKNSDDTGIEYEIKADGNNDLSNEFLKLKIIVITTDSRQQTRIINFNLLSAEI